MFSKFPGAREEPVASAGSWDYRERKADNGFAETSTMAFPEGPYIQLLGNEAPKYHTIEGIMGPNSLMVVYVDPLGLI